MGTVRIEIKLKYNGKIYRFLLDERGKGSNNIKSSAEWQYKKEMNAILSSIKFL